MLETLHKDKALPPLGRTLDIRSSHPAENVRPVLVTRGFHAPLPDFTGAAALCSNLNGEASGIRADLNQGLRFIPFVRVRIIGIENVGLNVG